MENRSETASNLFHAAIAAMFAIVTLVATLHVAAYPWCDDLHVSVREGFCHLARVA